MCECAAAVSLWHLFLYLCFVLFCFIWTFCDCLFVRWWFVFLFHMLHLSVSSKWEKHLMFSRKLQFVHDQRVPTDTCINILYCVRYSHVVGIHNKSILFIGAFVDIIILNWGQCANRIVDCEYFINICMLSYGVWLCFYRTKSRVKIWKNSQ